MDVCWVDDLTFICEGCEGYAPSGPWQTEFTVADFEGDINGSIINNGYSHPWYVDSSEKHGGSYGYASRSITHNQESRFDVRLDQLPSRTGTLKFWVKCDSEGYYDKMRIYLNGQNVINTWVTSWGEFSINFTPSHSYVRFDYDKDCCVNRGRDRCWVDDITAVCPGDTYCGAGNAPSSSDDAPNGEGAVNE